MPYIEVKKAIDYVDNCKGSFAKTAVLIYLYFTDHDALPSLEFSNKKLEK